jgi:hypothetical protein
MNPESAGVPGVMLRLKRRIASYMYMLQISIKKNTHMYGYFGYCEEFILIVFSQEMLDLDPGMRHRMDEDKVQH